MGRIAVNCVKDAIDYKVKRLPISGSMYIGSNDEDAECGADEYILNSDLLNAMSENGADSRILQAELRDRICEEVSKMSDKRQRVAQMLNVGYKPREIASVEGGTPQAVSKCIWNIREALRAALVEWVNDADRYAC